MHSSSQIFLDAGLTIREAIFLISIARSAHLEGAYWAEIVEYLGGPAREVGLFLRGERASIPEGMADVVVFLGQFVGAHNEDA